LKYYDFDVRIAYADTDRMGVVYYANYLVLFERGRTEFLRNLGVRYRDLEEKQRLFLPAMESHVEYLAPAHYDDLIKVRTLITELGGAHVLFKYEITLVDSGLLVARGATKHAVVNLLWRPTRLPQELRTLLENNLAS
jgi:acyl-CoA thioester hydrolase